MAVPELSQADKIRERFHKFFDVLGGVDGYLALQSQNPEMLQRLMSVYGVELDEQRTCKHCGNNPE